MKKITIPFNGKDFTFTYYKTNINTDHIYFVQTTDKHAAKMLVKDHFFITMDIRGTEPYYFNLIGGAEREADFKAAIADTILIKDFQVSPSPSQN